jgi:hypothetical protein
MNYAVLMAIWLALLGIGVAVCACVDRLTDIRAELKKLNKRAERETERQKWNP